MLRVCQVQDFGTALIFSPITQHNAGFVLWQALDFGSMGMAVYQHIDVLHLALYFGHVHVYRLVMVLALMLTAFAAKKAAQFLFQGKWQAFQNTQNQWIADDFFKALVRHIICAKAVAMFEAQAQALPSHEMRLL